jgi:3' exoribonuclease, RNase T-like
MRIFFDCEFTGLHQDTTLISIGLFADDGRTFYAETTDYAADQVDDWIRENVIAHLGVPITKGLWVVDDRRYHAFCGPRVHIAPALRAWLAQYDQVTMIGDVPHWDWVLFCDLFGALGVPENVFDIPLDLATALAVRGHDPDTSRAVLAELRPGQGYAGQAHNALHDAGAIRRVWRRVVDGMDE